MHVMTKLFIWLAIIVIGSIYINCIIPDSAVHGVLGPYCFAIAMYYMIE